MDVKKIIVFVIICLLLAGSIFWFTRSNNSDYGIESISVDEMIWVKCRNQNCDAEYQMSLQDYLQQTKAPPENPTGAKVAKCKECGQASLDRAIKCPKCGTIFFYGQLKNAYPDKCPKCGFSERQNRVKQ
ncbi:hypothetical protein SMSP2_01294 [Limihaloglobus sulfuriphilus]|uniref:Uncharacterized protein n=1 Tax=Limihaloglobus sulfuriphilus TaxID=1851148 RepID=A0A1Q2ME34_9BACT|nr:hypothetical protein [Limihaloglobus sulfuriphilus]AQQ70930.1 hypothetical protein SMSP2_01294 [Limihaloglobus sulfuriphilus]